MPGMGPGQLGVGGDRYAGFSLADETGKDSSARGGGDILGFGFLKGGFPFGREE